MSPCSPYVVVLTASQRSQLEAITRRPSAPVRQVLRARIVLAAAAGQSNAGIARALGVGVDTARKWRKRFCGKQIEGLVDLARSGRPRTFTAEQIAEVKVLACELPARTGLPLSRWSCPELAREVTARGVAEAISASTVRRILAADAIKPWQHRSWIFPRDPYFAPKAAGTLDLYARMWDGDPLGADDYVLSADEKPGSRPATASAAAFHRRRGARCGSNPNTAAAAPWPISPHTTCTAPASSAAVSPAPGSNRFTRLTGQVMTQEPYAGARRVFWIVDNGASHRNWAAAARLNDAYPNAHMVHLPVHASWLNQVEVYFSIVQRKALCPDNFTDLDAVADRLLTFQDHYNATARPFDWTFTRDDLNDLLHRLGRHDPAAPLPLPA